jgi:AraC-like DNA-binding protein
MKIQLESIQPDADSSFHLMLNPRLNDFYFWHFHPHFELTYIAGASGKRHVGEHISRYEGSDLVFIGSNIPHLNFDYGIKTDYEKTVLHIQPDFLKEALLNTPELAAIRQFFEKAKYGVAISGATKAKAGKMLKNLHLLSAFEQFLEVLRIFQLLANSTDITLLHDAPAKNQYNKKAQDRLQQLYRFIDDNYQRKIEVEEVAVLCRMTKGGFCRYFKQITRLTFTDFLNHYRINQAKRLLLLDKNVSETCYECGFESLSYFNRMFKKITTMNPLTYKKQYLLSGF